MPRLALLLGTVALAVVAPASWITARATQATSPLAPKELASPATGNAAQPQLSVSSRGVLLSWIERSGDLAALKFAERTAAGWTEVRTVASGRDWFVNWADVPSVMRLPNGTIVGHWLQKSGRRHLRLRRAALVLEGRWQELVAVIHPASRRH